MDICRRHGDRDLPPDGISTYRPPAVQPGGWPFDLTPRVMWPEAPLAWAVGQAPSGTERVEAVLPSGASYRWK